MTRAAGKPDQDARKVRLDIGTVDRVPGRANRPDDVADRACVQRLAQPPDVDVHRACLDVNIMPPDRIEQLLAREDTTGIPQEMTQQAKFRWAEMNRLAGA